MIQKTSAPGTAEQFSSRFGITELRGVAVLPTPQNLQIKPVCLNENQGARPLSAVPRMT